MGTLRKRKQVRQDRKAMMKGQLSVVLLMALATTLASAAVLSSSSSSHHRQKRALPAIPFLIAYKSGGSGAGPLPPHVDPNIGQSSAQLNSMSTSASMSGPLAVMGILNIIASGVMAMNYFQAVNARRRSGPAYGGPYIQKRSSLNFDAESIASLVNSFSESKTPSS